MSPTPTEKKRGPRDTLSGPPTSLFAWLRRTARRWGFLAFVLLILTLFRSVILPFVLALLVAYILAPLLRHLSKVRLGRHEVPRFVWIILIYIVLLGLITLFFTSFVPRLSNDIKKVVQEMPVFWKKAREQWVPRVASWAEENFHLEEPPPKPSAATKPLKKKSSGPRILVKRLEDGQYELRVEQLNLEVKQKGKGQWAIRPPSQRAPPPDSQDRTAQAINKYARDLVVRGEKQINQVFRLGQKFLVGIFHALTTFILVLMVSAFLLADTGSILRLIRGLMPRIYFQDFDNVIELIDKGLSGAIRGQFIICLINGFLTWVGLHIIGVKYPLLLGLMAGVMSLIPIFGSIISSIPIVIVALVSGKQGLDMFTGVLILLWIIGIHLLEANLLNPKIMGKAAKIHPVLVIFAVVAGEKTYGPMGALLGVPLFSAVQAVFVYLREKVRGPFAAPSEEEAESQAEAEPEADKQ